jgi:hypothetical protein
MSKTQEKRAARLAESEEFIKERRKSQIAIFEANFKAGLSIYEANKDKLTLEQIAEMEAEIESNLNYIEEYKSKWL